MARSRLSTGRPAAIMEPLPADSRLAALRKALALSISVWREDETEASVLRRCEIYVSGLASASESLIGAWLVTSVNEWAVGQERVLVLTSVAIHRLRFDRERMAVVALTRMPLRCVRRVLVDANPRSFNLLHPGEASVRVYTDREDGRRSVGEWGQRLQTAVGALAACGDVGEKPPAQRRHAERLYTPMAPPLWDGSPNHRRIGELARQLACALTLAVEANSLPPPRKRAASPAKAAELPPGVPVGECSICLEPLAKQQCAVLMANGLRACNAHFFHEACAAQLARSSHMRQCPLCRANYDAIRRVPLLSEEEADEPRLATLIMSMHV